MRKAASLLAALESARRSPEQEEEAARQDASSGDLNGKLDALFADEYSLPDLDEDL